MGFFKLKVNYALLLVFFRIWPYIEAQTTSNQTTATEASTSQADATQTAATQSTITQTTASPTTASETDENEYTEEFPYQVSLHLSFNDQYVCAGSIVGSKVVLTAAHCMYYKWGGLMPPLVVVVSAGRRNLNDSALRNFEVANITLHPSFDRVTMENDLAIVEVKDEFPYNDLIGVVSLEKLTPEAGYNRCVVTGWSQTSYEFEVTEVTISQCEYFSSRICTQKVDSNDITCTEEPGNPLTCDGKLLGVLSVGHDCSDPTQMTLFEDVRNSVHWLDRFDLTVSRAPAALNSVLMPIAFVLILKNM